MDDKMKYVQMNIFYILKDQSKQREQESYDICDHYNTPCCSLCKYLEEEVKDNVWGCRNQRN